MSLKNAAGSTAYRVDLDGLRGFAIALVVIFHVFVGRVSGGVDVFLLLSGYFFLGGQLRYALRPHPKLNPWWPLWRTLRRLVPALVLTLLATLAAIVFLTPELMNNELARQFTASILYFQNFELIAQEADYAAASQTTSPLQHLWSMSVQGQFYIVAILFGTLIALAVSRFKLDTQRAQTSAIVVLALLTIASFTYATRHGFVGTGENYYSTLSRAWELSLGGLLAFVPARRFIPQRYAGLSAALGVVMIAMTGIVVTTSLAFPGPIALLPLGGAALVILSGNSNFVANVLASNPMTWLGKIAYSLYLWHWPLLIITTRVANFEAPPWWLGVVVIVVSLALAQISYALIEAPLKQHRKRPTALDTPIIDARKTLRTAAGIGRALGGTLITALVAATLAIQPVWAQRVANADQPLNPAIYPGAMATTGQPVADVRPRPNPNLISGIYPAIGDDGCMLFLPDAPDALPPADCVYGDELAETTVVLVGGSHSEPFGIPLDTLGQRHGFRVIPFIRQECPLVIGGEDRFDLVSEECGQWSEMIFDIIVEMNPDLVISTSTRPEGRAGHVVVSQDYVPDAYRNLWQNLSYYGIPFLGLRDNPWMFDEDGTPRDPNMCIVAGFSEAACSNPIDAVYAPVDPAAQYLDGTNNQWSVDTSSWYCNEELCPPQIGNVYIYRDQNHLSNAYAATLAPLLWQEIRAAFDALGTEYRP